MEKAQIEEKVHQIFAQYIKRDFTNRDDFFMLGGHSIEATQVVLQIEKAFNIRISDAEIKNLRTVAELSSFVLRKLG
jgi:acyl carrier protein